MISRVWGGVDLPVTQPYGPNHRGIDIGMAAGTPLWAARAGRATAVGPGYLCLEVGFNLRDWYLHIISAMVALGAFVQTDELAAYSGAVQVPGGPPPTGPHLHFEVQTGHLDDYATSLDPVPVLTGLYGPAVTPLVPRAARTLTLMSGNHVNQFAVGAGGALFQRRDGGPWRSLGGGDISEISGKRTDDGRLAILAVGSKGALYEIASPDDGSSWLPWVDTKGSGSSLLTL